MPHLIRCVTVYRKNAHLPVLRKVKKLLVDPLADPDQHANLITSRGSSLAHGACYVWSTSVNTLVSHPAYKQNKWQTEWSHYSPSRGEVIKDWTRGIELSKLTTDRHDADDRCAFFTNNIVTHRGGGHNASHDLCDGIACYLKLVECNICMYID